MGVQLPDHGQRGGKLECGVINVGRRLANDFEESGHKVKAVYGSIEEGVDVDGLLNLTWG